MRRPEVFLLLALAVGGIGALSARAAAGADDRYIEYNDHKGLDLSVTAGSFLPWGIVGVRDIYDMWGVKFSHPTQVARLEYQWLNAHDNGVDYNVLSASARIDYQMAAAFDGYFSFGGDLHYYRRKASPGLGYPYYQAGGAHFGFGAFYDFSKSLGLRADFQSNWSPGKSLFAGIGLIYRFGGADAGKSE